jgi:hypothetical protein
VKVTTESGIIHAGDQLTTSSLTGYAMRAVKSGKIIGIALESMDESQLSSCNDITANPLIKCGTVLMFVNLSHGEGELFDTSEIATDAAILTATITTPATTASDSASAKSIENLTINGLSVDGSATIAANLRVKQNALIEGILTVVDTITTHNLIVSSIANFFDTVIFHGDVSFKGTPTFNNDTAGTAVVKKGTDSVTIVFEKAYANSPIVNATMSSDVSVTGVDDQLRDEQQNNQGKKILANNTSYVISNRTEKGFTILLNKPAGDDITFSWIALVVGK